MTNAEKIRSLNDDELSAFLFKLSIKTLTGFMEAGGFSGKTTDSSQAESVSGGLI